MNLNSKYQNILKVNELDTLSNLNVVVSKSQLNYLKNVSNLSGKKLYVVVRDVIKFYQENHEFRAGDLNE